MSALSIAVKRRLIPFRSPASSLRKANEPRLSYGPTSGLRIGTDRQAPKVAVWTPEQTASRTRTRECCPRLPAWRCREQSASITSAFPTGRRLDVQTVAIRHSGREHDMLLDPLFDVSWRYDLMRSVEPSPQGDGRRAQRGSIFTVAVSGTAPRRRLTQGSDDADPAWSAHDERIVFSRHLRKSQVAIYLMTGDGTGERPLVSSGANEKPAWAGQGNVIAFVRKAPGVVTDAKADLWLVGADGEPRRPKPLHVEAARFGTAAWRSR
jgi:hypothetical protein